MNSRFYFNLYFYLHICA